MKSIGTFHTHPYDKTMGGYKHVSLSPGDIWNFISRGDKDPIQIVQSGDMQFALVRTLDTPTNVDLDTLSKKHLARFHELVKQGYKFARASQIAAAEITKEHNVTYYEGTNGVLRRAFSWLPI